MRPIPTPPDRPWISTHERVRFHSRLRSARLRASRSLGAHTQEEWEALKLEFYFRCVRCGADDVTLERDHVVPVYQGGCDCILNIQPVCAWCNTKKGPETFNWAAYRRAHGFDR